MADGTPVLFEEKASLPEVLGYATLLVNPETVGEIWMGMGRLAVDRALRSELSRKGSERVKIYTWERSAHILKGIYEELVTLEERHAVV